MKALTVLCYLGPVAVVWGIWAALVFLVGVPGWFGELVKYGAIAQTAVVVFVVSIIGGIR